MHLPGALRQNKYARWHACKRCGLRLSYVVKGTYQGETRAIGPEPTHVEAAQMELAQQYAKANMNEKIFNGKLMEIRGRGLVHSGGAGRTTVMVKADERLGKTLMAGTGTTEPGMASTTMPTMPGTTATPTTPTTVPETPEVQPEFQPEPRTPVTTKAKPKAPPAALLRVKKELMEPPTELAAASSTPAETSPKETQIYVVDEVLTISSEGES